MRSPLILTSDCTMETVPDVKFEINLIWDRGQTPVPYQSEGWMIMKIFREPSYDRFNLFDTERKTSGFKGMGEAVNARAGQAVDVTISDEGMKAYRDNLKEIKPESEEPVGYELTLEDTNELEWEHYTSMMEYSCNDLKDGNYNLEDVMKSMMDAYEARYNEIVKEHENGDRHVSYELTGESTVTLEEDLAGLDRAYNRRLANLRGYITCQQTTDGKAFFGSRGVNPDVKERTENSDDALAIMEKARARFLEKRKEPDYTSGIAKTIVLNFMKTYGTGV